MKNVASSIFAILALVCSPVFAQAPTPVDPATSAAVRKMLIVMDYRNVTKASIEQLAKSMPDMLASGAKAAIENDKRLNDVQRKEAIREAEKVLPLAFAKVNAIISDPAVIDEMIEAMIPVWARTFTVSEIEQLSALYGSPLGKKMLSSMPQMMSESMQASQRVLAPRINAVMSDVVKPSKK